MQVGLVFGLIFAIIVMGLFLAFGTGAIDEKMHLASLMNLSFGFAFVTQVKEIIKNLQE